MSQTIRKREEIPVEDTWKLEDLYASDEAWEQSLELLKQEGQTLAAFKGQLNQAETLYIHLPISINCYRTIQITERREKLKN